MGLEPGALFISGGGGGGGRVHISGSLRYCFLPVLIVQRSSVLTFNLQNASDILQPYAISLIFISGALTF